MEGSRLAIISCKSGKPFAEKVFAALGRLCPQATFIPSEEIQFANSEIKTEIKETIRDKDLYIFQDVENSQTGLSIADNVHALKTACNAAKICGAERITAVLPVFPYARQDKTKVREGITASTFAAEMELDVYGVSRIVTLDIHNEAIQGYFRKANLENMHAYKNISEYVKEHYDLSRLKITAPDFGALDRAKDYRRELKCDIVTLEKSRSYSSANQIDDTILVGDVRGCYVLLVDDMIDTAGTIEASCRELMKHGAVKVIVACSLPLLNGPAISRLEKAFEDGIIDKVIGTDAVYHGEALLKKTWYAQVSVAGNFANVIYGLHEGKSIGSLLR